LVGQIRNISTQATNVTYKIDDGTGVIEVKQWNDNEMAMGDPTGPETGSKSSLVEDGYCRVWGKLKAFDNKKYVGAHDVRPITDYNEIHYHLLDATAVHLFFTKGPSPLEAAKTSAAAGSSGNHQNAGMTDTGGGGTQQNGQAAPGTSSMSPGARRLLQTLKSTPQSNEGLHVQDLASQMGTNTNEAQRAAEELISLGMIFTTVDEYTWALLEY
jgi:replication factor A2